MTKAYCLVIFLLILLINIPGAEIVIATSPWPPYADKSLPEWGFTTEIIKEAYKSIDITATFIITDWSLCLEKCASGDYDALYNVGMTIGRAEHYAFTEPYASFKIYLISLKDRGITYQSLEDLKAYKFCSMIGYANSKEYNDATYLSKTEVPLEIDALKLLFSGDVDLVVIDKFVCAYVLRSNLIFKDNISDVKFIEPPLITGTAHLMFYKSGTGFYEKVMEFNNGLAKIKENGTYEAILKKHNAEELIK